MSVLKVIGGVVGAYVGWSLWKNYKAAHSASPLVAGKVYSAHLQYAGAGVGGAPTQDQLQSVINAGAQAAGIPTMAGLQALSAPTVDPTNKLISFTLGSLQNVTMPWSVLSGAWTAAYGKVKVLAVQDVGNQTAPAAGPQVSMPLV